MPIIGKYPETLFIPISNKIISPIIAKKSSPRHVFLRYTIRLYFPLYSFTVKKIEDFSPKVY
jgi:hypothetical protein